MPIIDGVYVYDETDIIDAEFSDFLNKLGDSLRSAEQDYVPTLTNLTLGDGTMVAKYQRVGKTIRGSVSIVFGSTTAITAPNPRIGLPVPAASIRRRFLYSGHLFDTGTAYFSLWAKLESTTSIGLFYERADAPASQWNFIQSTLPFTWVAGDEIMISFEYAAA